MAQAYSRATEGTGDRIAQALGAQAGGISAGDIPDEAVAEMVRDEWEV